MASACVNNIGVTPPDNFLSIGWLSPRISFKDSSKIPESSPKKKIPDLEDSTATTAAGDFEFCLDVHHPATILPADELFSDGKLVPLHFPKPPQSQPHTATKSIFEDEVIRSPEKDKPSRSSCDGFVSGLGNDPYLFSPKAPRCSSRWRELLGLKNKRLSSGTTAVTITAKTVPSSSKPLSIRHFLHRNSRMSTSSSNSSSDGGSSSINLPLLHRSSDSSSLDCCSSRLSLSSSSSSGHEHDDLPRLSLDAEKPIERQPRDSLSFRSTSGPKVRLVRPRMVPAENTTTNSSSNQKPLIDHPSAAPVEARRIGRSPIRRAQQTDPPVLAADSPRMNPSGKIVFKSLERSSSSPSSFNGGPRHKHRGMERSYSANVRVTPVLNVPVCSLRGSSKSGVFGFGQLFSSSSSTSQSQKNSNSNNGGSASGRYHHHRRKESS